jgi:methionyl aminopeptidase
MIVESDNDVERLRRVGRIVARVLRRMLDVIEPGMTTAELDAYGERLLARAGARSAPRLAYRFPGATCISVNEEVAHGIPGTRRLHRGDVVNVDVSAELDGYYADTGGTRVVPPSDPRKEALCAATRSALAAALRVAQAGQPLGGIGRAIQGVADAHGLRVIENLGSHGIGRRLHEAPGFIPGYDDPRERRRLREGMVITIEPFLSTRSRRLRLAADGWTLKGTADNLSAQFEHTLIVTRAAPIVLTRP